MLSTPVSALPPGGTTSPDSKRMYAASDKKQYTLSKRAVSGMRAPDAVYGAEDVGNEDRDSEAQDALSASDEHNGEEGNQGAYLQSLDKGLVRKILGTLRPPV